MLVNSSNVLVVPPWECAWLSEEQYQLQDSSGCVCFEVKGENDATVILKPSAGSKRWQHYVRDDQAAAHLGNLHTENNYTIILGSHRNSCLKIEKELAGPYHQAESVPGSRLSGDSFTRFWINYNKGTITVGVGEPGQDSSHYSWTDADPIADIKHIGLSAWDKHVGYRHIHVNPAVSLQSPQQQQAQLQKAPHVQYGTPSLRQLCRESLEQHLNSETVCQALYTVEALEPALNELKLPLMAALGSNIQQVVEDDPNGFCQLPSNCLEILFQETDLACSELSLFQACMVWAEAPGRSMQEVEKLLPLIRYPFMTQQELQVVCNHPLAQQSLLLHDLICEAVAAHQESHDLDPYSQVQLQQAPVMIAAKRYVHGIDHALAGATQRFQRRRPSACQELMFMFDGDDNGVCQHAATDYGKQEWVNPVLSGTLKVTASSPVCRNTDPKALVSGNFLRMNFAGPQIVGGQTQTWWQVDLGAGCKLTCNHYTLRHDGSQDFLRSWKLQGCNEGQAWVTLRSHTNDVAINLPGQYASWPVTSHAAMLPYQMFRLLLTGCNAGRNNNMCLSHLEFYGYFIRQSESGGHVRHFSTASGRHTY